MAEEREALAYADLENQDPSVDAPWPVVVKTAAGDRKPKSMEEAVNFLLEDQELFTDILKIPEARSALRILSEYGDPITVDGLSDLSEGAISLEQAELILNWASRLGCTKR